MQAFVQAVEGSAINNWVLGAAWIWPTLEILHFMGLSLLLGSLLVIDLRMAGFFRQLNIAATHKLLPWTFAGFGINATTGFLFLMGDPARYTANIGFRWNGPRPHCRAQRTVVLDSYQPGNEDLGATRRRTVCRQGDGLDIAWLVVRRIAPGAPDSLYRHRLSNLVPVTPVSLARGPTGRTHNLLTALPIR